MRFVIAAIEHAAQYRLGIKTVIVAVALLAAGLGMMAAATTSGAQDALPTRLKIASNYVQTNGCHDVTTPFTTQVPNVDRLDRSYHGVVDGLEVVEVTGVNGHAYRNFRWVNNGIAISYELYAKGAGHWVDPPKIFGQPIGGGACIGAEGGSEGIEVFAHYQ
jgi:hypothetical protein